MYSIADVVMAQTLGMEQFRTFLHDTAGLDLLNFWLDCENFKDTIEDYDDLELMITRNRLYRFPRFAGSEQMYQLKPLCFAPCL